MIFFPERNKPNIHNNINDISSFQNGLNYIFNSTGFYLKSKVIEGSHKGKNAFFNFWAILLKMYSFEVVTFFFASWLSNQLNFSVMVHIYTIRIFDETFFLLILRMTMITKLFRMVTCCKELSPIYIYMTSQRSGLVGSRGK